MADADERSESTGSSVEEHNAPLTAAAIIQAQQQQQQRLANLPLQSDLTVLQELRRQHDEILMRLGPVAAAQHIRNATAALKARGVGLTPGLERSLEAGSASAAAAATTASDLSASTAPTATAAASGTAPGSSPQFVQLVPNGSGGYAAVPLQQSSASQQQQQQYQYVIKHPSGLVEVRTAPAQTIGSLLHQQQQQQQSTQQAAALAQQRQQQQQLALARRHEEIRAAAAAEAGMTSTNEKLNDNASSSSGEDEESNGVEIIAAAHQVIPPKKRRQPTHTMEQDYVNVEDDSNRAAVAEHSNINIDNIDPSTSHGHKRAKPSTTAAPSMHELARRQKMLPTVERGHSVEDRRRALAHVLEATQQQQQQQGEQDKQQAHLVKEKQKQYEQEIKNSVLDRPYPLPRMDEMVTKVLLGVPGYSVDVLCEKNLTLSKEQLLNVEACIARELETARASGGDGTAHAASVDRVSSLEDTVARLKHKLAHAAATQSSAPAAPTGDPGQQARKSEVAKLNRQNVALKEENSKLQAKLRNQERMLEEKLAAQKKEYEGALRAYMKSAVHSFHRLQRKSNTN